MLISAEVEKEFDEQLDGYTTRLVEGLDEHFGSAKRVNYRKLAFDHYGQNGQVVCAHCGFGIRDVLEVAHLDCNRSNNKIENLAILCPTCHKMHDLDLISTDTIVQMRDRPKVVVWGKRMKDAGAKAAQTNKRRRAAEKAARTRRKNVVAAQSVEPL